MRIVHDTGFSIGTGRKIMGKSQGMTHLMSGQLAKSSQSQLLHGRIDLIFSKRVLGQSLSNQKILSHT